MTYPVVQIQWEDPTSYTEWRDFTPDLLDDIRPRMNTTVGFKVHECDDYMIFAGSIASSHDPVADESDFYGDLFVIPKVLVKSTKYLTDPDLIHSVQTIPPLLIGSTT